jgi:cytochrome c oxidase subunit 1
MAELMRLQLAQPDEDLISTDRYNQLFTMHGTIMLLLFVSPFALGLANYIVPLQVGAKDMAFPGSNALGYWLTLFAGIVMLGGFATKDGAAKFGWYGYAPLSDGVRSPNVGGDLWIVGIALLGLSGVLTALNVIATVICMRAPGMTMFRMPVFTWNIFVTSLLILMTFPVLTAAGVMLFFDRQFDARIFDANHGGYPCCGSTCSGSSVTPRCTSSCCRSSASSPRSSPCSPAGRCSATRRSSSPRWRSASCPSACGPTTCSRPAPCSCRSSRS